MFLFSFSSKTLSVTSQFNVLLSCKSKSPRSKKKMKLALPTLRHSKTVQNMGLTCLKHFQINNFNGGEGGITNARTSTNSGTSRKSLNQKMESTF
jgi:hypothetical protein